MKNQPFPRSWSANLKWQWIEGFICLPARGHCRKTTKKPTIVQKSENRYENNHMEIHWGKLLLSLWTEILKLWKEKEWKISFFAVIIVPKQNTNQCFGKLTSQSICLQREGWQKKVENNGLLPNPPQNPALTQVGKRHIFIQVIIHICIMTWMNDFQIPPNVFPIISSIKIKGSKRIWL